MPAHVYGEEGNDVIETRARGTISGGDGADTLRPKRGGVTVLGGAGTDRADCNSGIARVDGFDDAPQPIVLQPGESAKSAFLWRNTHASADPPQVGSHVDIAAGGTFQSLLPASPGKDVTIDLGSTGRMGVRAWHR